MFHATVYQAREPLTVVGIREHEVELKGDYSGGTHPVEGTCWLPIKGLRKTRNTKPWQYSFK